MLYRDDPEWGDVEKIKQDDGPHPLVAISYSNTFIDVMDCFRGVLRSNELSERTLQLTNSVIQCNPANYTAWCFRRKALEYLQSDLHAELAYTQKMAIAFPKNYQIWHHRREICVMLQDGSYEKEFCAKALEEDSKNYHAWAHRQWAVKYFKLWDGELEYVESMLAKDVRNNSAWNQRWFVFQHNTSLLLEDRQKELEFVWRSIASAVNNESAWNYLRAVMRGHEGTFCNAVMTKCERILDDAPDSVPTAAILVDLYTIHASTASIEKAKQVVDRLIGDIDHTRKAYWGYRKKALEKLQ